MENTLSSVEGQRVMQVLDETLNATRLMSCVTSDLRSRATDVADLVGPEVTETLLQHVDLLEDYEANLERCGGEPKSNDMVDVTLRLQDSVRTLSRLPGQYPGLVDKLMVMAMDTDMQRVVARGVHTLEGLKHITFQKLITTVEEENSRYVQRPIRLAPVGHSSERLSTDAAAGKTLSPESRGKSSRSRRSARTWRHGSKLRKSRVRRR
jgi:hypothetical protein